MSGEMTSGRQICEALIRKAELSPCCLPDPINRSLRESDRVNGHFMKSDASRKFCCVAFGMQVKIYDQAFSL